MNNQNNRPVPLTILTGFLGAGKTTLLNRILRADHGLRIAVLVNDFGKINIDQEMVVGNEPDAINLANGCICCTLGPSLFASVMQLFERSPKPEYIIIEGSGVADPVGIIRHLTVPDLQPLIQVDSVLAVVDAERILTWTQVMDDLPRSQIQTANTILLNKIDLVEQDTLQKIRDWIYDVAPTARVLETVQCDVPLELILHVGQFAYDGLDRQPLDVHVHSDDADHHHHEDHTKVFTTWSWETSVPLDYAELNAVLEELPTGVMRAKGFVHLADQPSHRFIFQGVGRRGRLEPGEPWQDAKAQTRLVFIGLEGELDIATLTAALEACKSGNGTR